MVRNKHNPTKYSSSRLDFKTIIKYVRLLQNLIISLEVDDLDLNNNNIITNKSNNNNNSTSINSSNSNNIIKRRGRPKKNKDDDKNIIIKKEDPPINNYDDTVKVDYTGILNDNNYLGINELMNNGDIELK